MSHIPGEWTDDRTPLDFIVVGAGAGGAPLAARLVERGYTVLVVEMGPRDLPTPEGAAVENTEVPLLNSEVTEDDRHSLRFFVDHFPGGAAASLDPKVHRPPGAPPDEQGIFYPRAAGVGGCTVHNAMITVCGPSEDWDEIAEATGDESWRGERMRAYFQRVERCDYARPSRWARWLGRLGFGTGWENARHGTRGWLDTTLSDLRFVKRDGRFLRVVLGGALAALRSGVVGFGELLLAVVFGRVSPALDPNNWERMRKNPEGVARIPCAITPGGERSGPRERLLRLTAHGLPAASRLHLLTDVCVTEVALEETPAPDSATAGGPRYRATGVYCLPRDRVYQAAAQARPPADDWQKELVTLRCRKEVILCGGTFNTPQLLMLSGIGAERRLRDVPVKQFRVDLPGVGANLQDRYEVSLVATITDRFRSLDGIGLSSRYVDPHLQRWMDRKRPTAFDRGLYATNGGLVGFFVRSDREDAAPDLFVAALAGHFAGYRVGWSKPGALAGLKDDLSPEQVAAAPHRALTWLILKARTRQHGGWVRLRGPDPFQRPEVNFDSFPLAPDPGLEPPSPEGPFPSSADPDLEALFQGVQFVQKILNIGQAHGTIERHELPGFDDCFGGNVRKWIKHAAWGHHACGTCRIGGDRDATAVVDSRFRVRGVRGLRVADASVFPRIPGFFIVANVYMIAEKAADMITEDHPIPPAKLPPDAREALKLDPVLPSAAAFEARRVYPAEMEAAEARLVAARRRAAGLVSTNRE
jgi:choline dehydrogenase